MAAFPATVAISSLPPATSSSPLELRSGAAPLLRAIGPSGEDWFAVRLGKGQMAVATASSAQGLMSETYNSKRKPLNGGSIGPGGFGLTPIQYDDEHGDGGPFFIRVYTTPEMTATVMYRIAYVPYRP